MEYCTPAVPPLPKEDDRSKRDGEELLHSVTHYQKLVAGIILLSKTIRPDLSFVTSTFSGTMENPIVKMWKPATILLCYLTMTPRKGVVYRAPTVLTISGNSDFDWGKQRPDRKLINGSRNSVSRRSNSLASQPDVRVAQGTLQAIYVVASLAVRKFLY